MRLSCGFRYTKEKSRSCERDFVLSIWVALLYLCSLYGAVEVALDCALLFKLALKHSDAEDEENEGHRIECAEAYATVSIKDCEQKEHSVVNGRGQYDSADVCSGSTLFKSADKIRALEEAVILGRAADHFASEPYPFSVILNVDFRLSFIIVKLDLIVYEFVVVYGFEKLIA